MVTCRNLILTSLALVLYLSQVYTHSEPVIVPVPTKDCPADFATSCSLQCPNNKYVRDSNDCATCACATNEPKQPAECPLRKCRANCGPAGYVVDENGCRTCDCVSKKDSQCSRVMCRMYCTHGFKRDQNGCQYCACNESPQACPTLSCEQTCKTYRKDYSGCPTCDCDCSPLVCPASLNNCTKSLKKDADGCPVCSCDEQIAGRCPPFQCNLTCKQGFQLDTNGCKLCSCNRCSSRSCRMFCTYGFRRNNDECEICECDWTPIGENIQCSERIPCPGTRVCNLNMKLCEIVKPDRVNWFVYEFKVQTELFKDPKFAQTFKNGLIHNIATKYDLKISQVTVSAVDHNGLTSFQIMPYYSEDMEAFQNKIDQIDLDLNSHEFRAVLPAIVNAVEDGAKKQPSQSAMGRLREKWDRFTSGKRRFIIYTICFLLACGVIIFALMVINMLRRPVNYTNLSDSKSPIYDTGYHKAPTEDEQYHAVHAPDGTAYVIVQGEDPSSMNDKRALV